MKYVLDASVALKWVLSESDSNAAIAIRSESENGRCELLAPDVFPAECGHALTRAERRKIIGPGDSIIHLSDIVTSLPRLCPSLPLLHTAVELASQKRISFYDCLYVALAEREQCELLTADLKLATLLPNSPIVVLSTLRL